MMLLFCQECADVCALQDDPRWCRCTKSSGVLLSNGKAAIQGPGRYVDMSSGDIMEAMEAGFPSEVSTFLHPEESKFIKRGKLRMGRLPKHPSYIVDDDE